MTQEHKDLLLKDLCSRLPYGVKAEKYTIRLDGEIVPLREAEVVTAKDIISREDWPGYTIKPYLFPLSSMTEEQTKIYLKLESMCILSSTDKIGPKIEFFDWLNRNHFDYRGLIGKGLAIDATNLKIY